MPTTSRCSTATSPGPPATRSPDASSRPAAACRSSCSPRPTGSTTRPPGSSSAPTTISPSPSSSGSWCSVSGRSTAGASTTGHPCARSPGCGWTRSAARSTATAATSRSPANSSPSSRSSSRPKAESSVPKSSCSGRGIRTPIRSPTPCASRSRRCANGSASPGSSPPCPAPGTASTLSQPPRATERTVDRAPGLSVRLKLTLSYAGFLMLAGTVLLAAGYFSLSRGVHPGLIFMVRSHADLLHFFAPRAAAAMGFLLAFGLLGGWILAGRMLAPLTRITDATRTATTGSLSHRIQLPGRRDEFRELADGFDTMLARLEAHVAEQQRFAANASHELRTPLAITQTLLDVARTDPSHRTGELVDRLHAVNTQPRAGRSVPRRRGSHRDSLSAGGKTWRHDRELCGHRPDRRLARAAAADDHEPRAQRDRPQPAGAGVRVGHHQGRPQRRAAHRREHQRPDSPKAGVLLSEPFPRGTERTRTDHAGVGLGPVAAARAGPAG